MTTLRIKLGGMAVVVSILVTILAADTAAAASTKKVVWTVGPHACANQDTPVTASNLKAEAAAMVCLVNEQRAHWGLPKVTVAPALNESAQAWTNKMIKQNFFSHGGRFQNRITAAGYRWNAAGENLATGFKTPAQVMHAWMLAPSHCKNILSPYLSHIGTGLVAKGVKSLKSGYATWTEDFANPYGTPFPSKKTGPVKGCPYNVTIS